MKVINLFTTVRFSWLFSIPMFVLTGIILAVAGTMLVAHRATPDPFARFSDLFQNNARQAAVAHGVTCHSEFSHDVQPSSDYCIQQIDDRVFSSLYLHLSGDAAGEISFSVRENTLLLGDLILLWGKPEIQLYCETSVAVWPARHITTIVAPGRIGRNRYALPVLSVSFTRSGAPHWESLLRNDALHQCGSVVTGSLESYSALPAKP